MFMSKEGSRDFRMHCQINKLHAFPPPELQGNLTGSSSNEVICCSSQPPYFHTKLAL